jgi:hypothetical protein
VALAIPVFNDLGRALPQRPAHAYSDSQWHRRLPFVHRNGSSPDVENDMLCLMQESCADNVTIRCEQKIKLGHLSNTTKLGCCRWGLEESGDRHVADPVGDVFASPPRGLHHVPVDGRARLD